MWWMIGRVRLALYLSVFYTAAFVAFLVFQPIWLERFEARPPARAFSAEYEPEFNKLRCAPDEPGGVCSACEEHRHHGMVGERGPVIHDFVLLDRRGTEAMVLDADDLHANSCRRAAPGASYNACCIPFRTPPQAGLYLLALDISQTGMNWFSGTGVVPGIVEVEIQPGAQPLSEQTNWYKRTRPELQSFSSSPA
jgi:hypothetical protein